MIKTFYIIIFFSFLKTVSGQSRTEFVGTFHQDNDTIIINSDLTFKLSIQGHDSMFILRREIYTGKGQIIGNLFKLTSFDQNMDKIIFWKCDEITLKRNKLYAPMCNLTTSRKIYKRLTK